jgi:hypothetical protein
MRAVLQSMLAARVVLVLLGWPLPALAGDRFELQGLFDLRAVHTDGAASFIYGGSGRLRFDPDHDGVRIGRLLLSGRYRLNDTWTFNAVGGSYADPDKHPLDLTEMWFEARPFPQGPVRFKWRVGAFHLPASLENRAVGWTTPYSISSSAINTWIGEELRIIGTEFEARWKGASRGYFGEVAFTAGVYGWNDPAGDLIAGRGWGMSDRQSTLFGGLGRPREAFYREIDGRPGVYAGLSWRHHDGLEVRILRYDNRGDPGATNTDDTAWRTQFTSAGVRWEPDPRWTAIVQTMQGQTYVGPDGDPEYQYAESFLSWFALVSRQWGAGRLTARYDQFSTHQRAPTEGEYTVWPPTNDRGHGMTLAYLYDLTPAWQVVGEWQQVRSAFPPRAVFGEPVGISETQIQLSARYRFTLQR